ncbi:hypothetical protein E2C01_058639 [Portunus trituberculatus]|uniref:Uncharacterized protein n=1 Tax=Portunus trituberculatus TaxID=210409 RepID=A0A5B7GW37_PORTR|nr:hypothetical protein [Portunus trituberculatus]
MKKHAMVLKGFGQCSPARLPAYPLARLPACPTAPRQAAMVVTGAACIYTAPAAAAVILLAFMLVTYFFSFILSCIEKKGPKLILSL